MNRLQLIVGLIALALLAGTAWLLLGTKGASPVPTGTSGVGLPVATSTSVGNSGGTDTGATSGEVTSKTLARSDSGSITTLNFIADPTTTHDPINKNYYYLGYHVYEGVPDPTVTENPPYVIEFLNTTDFFNITLLTEPLGEVRSSMEQFLLARLGISQAEACALKYRVGVPSYVNEQYAGINLGFSFCRGATELP